MGWVATPILKLNPKSNLHPNPTYPTKLINPNRYSTPLQRATTDRHSSQHWFTATLVFTGDCLSVVAAYVHPCNNRTTKQVCSGCEYGRGAVMKGSAKCVWSCVSILSSYLWCNNLIFSHNCINWSIHGETFKKLFLKIISEMCQQSSGNGPFAVHF